MIRACAAGCMELAGTFFCGSCGGLREQDLACYRCERRCAAAAAKRAREPATLLGDDAALDLVQD